MMYTATQIKDLIVKYKCANGDTLEEVLDFCESIIFDTNYSKEEQDEYEALYKILLFGRLRLHNKRIKEGTNSPESHFDVVHHIPENFERLLSSHSGVINSVKHRDSIRYAYKKMRYNF